MSDTLDLKRIPLESLKIMSQMHISAELLNELADGHNFGIRWNDILDQLVLTLAARITTQKLEEITVSYPADWWQAFKKRWFPKWAKKRWPVEKRTHTVSAHALYPKIAMPTQCSTIYVKDSQPFWNHDA